MPFIYNDNMSEDANAVMKHYIDPKPPKVVIPAEAKVSSGKFTPGVFKDVSAPDFSALFNAIQTGHLVVAYHAKWCVFCQRMLPEYMAAAKKSKIPLIALEQSNIDKFISYYNDRIKLEPDRKKQAKYEALRPVINSFPTILIYNGGKVTKYSGERSASKFMAIE